MTAVLFSAIAQPLIFWLETNPSRALQVWEGERIDCSRGSGLKPTHVWQLCSSSPATPPGADLPAGTASSASHPPLGFTALQFVVYYSSFI